MSLNRSANSSGTSQPLFNVKECGWFVKQIDVSVLSKCPCYCSTLKLASGQFSNRMVHQILKLKSSQHRGSEVCTVYRGTSSLTHTGPPLGTALVFGLGVGAAALVAVTVPLTVDGAAWAMGVVEKRLSATFVTKAQRRLARVRPTVVAITGSYGKTSTKGYVAHLLAAGKSVVASPASFNNRLGLSRAVNDGLEEAGPEARAAEAMLPEDALWALRPEFDEAFVDYLEHRRETSSFRAEDPFVGLYFDLLRFLNGLVHSEGDEFSHCVQRQPGARLRILCKDPSRFLGRILGGCHAVDAVRWLVGDEVHLGVEQLADRSRFEQRLEDCHLAVEARDEAGDAFDAGIDNRVAQGPVLGHGERDRLFHQHVLAGLGGGDALLGVDVVGAAQVDDVHPRVGQHLFEGVPHPAVLDPVLVDQLLRAMGAAAGHRDDLDVEYFDYDWSLNGR